MSILNFAGNAVNKTYILRAQFDLSLFIIVLRRRYTGPVIQMDIANYYRDYT